MSGGSQPNSDFDKLEAGSFVTKGPCSRVNQLYTCGIYIAKVVHADSDPGILNERLLKSAQYSNRMAADVVLESRSTGMSPAV